MRKCINDIVMDHVVDHVVDHLHYKDVEDQTVGEIDLYLKTFYDDSIINMFHKNNGYIKVSNELQKRA